MSLVDDILAHHGVKGMHWGVRKSSGGSSSTPAHPDAIKVAASKKRIKSGGTKALSNQEFRDVLNRMQMDQQYSKLSPNKIKTGERVIKDILGVAGTVSAVYALSNSPAGKALKYEMMKKKMPVQGKLF